jgi:uncharacterized protein involved in exopolysaccharide biosynthesis
MTEEFRLIPRMAGPPAPTARDVVAVVFRQRRLATSSFLVILASILLYGFVAPCYRAEMKLLLRRGRLDPLVSASAEQPPLESQEVTEEELNSQADLLRDKELLHRVAEESGLIAGKPSWLRRLTGESSEARAERAVRRLSRRLSIEPVRKTAVITVSYESSDPARSARVLRCLAAAYLEQHLRLRRPSGELEFFAQQVQESRQALEAAEVHLMDFTREEGVVSAAQERDLALQKMGEVEAESRLTQVDIAGTAQRIRTLRLKLPSLPERIATVIRNSDNPQLMEKMKSTVLQLELKRTELLTRFQPTYRLVKEVEQQIAEAKEAIAQEELAPLRDQTNDLDPNHAWAKGELVREEVELSGLEARSRAANRVLASYRDQTQKLGERAIRQAELLSDLKMAEDQYLLYVNKREQARIGDALDQNRILNVALAEPPMVPALPARSEASLGLLGLVLAGTVSTGLAFAADRLDPAFRTPDEVAGYLGVPVLASLPHRSGEL